MSIGIPIGLKTLIPNGGQFIPMSIDGDNVMWKKAQKNEEKNNTSDKINIIIPNFNPYITFLVCNPWKVDSRIISRHHWNKHKINIKVEYKNNQHSDLWKKKINLKVKDIRLNEVIIGQGLLSTIWNGWFIIYTSLEYNVSKVIKT